MSPCERYAEAEIPTAHGLFRVVVFRFGADEHLAMIRGEVAGAAGVLCRVHSECLTGEALGSLKCDCRAQLEAAIAAIAAAGAGVLVYLRQEGRGIGLGNKIRAYALQAEGKDTVEANLALGFPPDGRSYEEAAAILKALDIRSVRLMTNNPDKQSGLEAAGVPVVERVPLWVEGGALAQGYLEVKRRKLGHIGEESGE